MPDANLKLYPFDPVKTLPIVTFVRQEGLKMERRRVVLYIYLIMS